MFRHKISKDQKQKKIFMKFELVFVLQLSKVEKTKKDFYRELMQIRLNFHPDHHKSIEYEESRGFQWILLEPNHSKFARSQQARHQDSVTGGTEINFGWAREVYFV